MSTKRSYSPEEKQSAVETFLQSKMSQQELAERYGTGKATIRNWLRLYQTFGMEGLSQQKQTTRYSPELKLSAVKAYLSGQGSLRELCHRYGIRSDRQLRNWIRKYNRHQESSTATPCSQHRQKGKLLMSRGRKTTFEERVAIVSYCIEHERDYIGTVKEYGVSYEQIYSWVRKYTRGGADALIDRRGKRKPQPAWEELTETERLQAENRLLKAENEELKLANRLLKKVREKEGSW